MAAAPLCIPPSPQGGRAWAWAGSKWRHVWLLPQVPSGTSFSLEKHPLEPALSQVGVPGRGLPS